MARKELSAEVREEIEKLIGTEFRKGEKIPSEKELCERFNVSRVTLREAIRELVSSHVLVIRRGVGTFVTMHPGVVDDPIGGKFMDKQKLISEIWETSLLLEPQFAYWAAERADSSEIAVIEEIQKEYESCFEEWQKTHSAELTRELFRLDGEFHLKIAKSTKNTVLYHIFRSYCGMINKEIDPETARGNADNIMKYHPMLINDLKNHDCQSAYEHMYRHDRELEERHLSEKNGK
ncbi:MAG: GntR family transcriptional regulator [Solobacterium sp.]|nr:GntR family transcriptional regulator [Solobacterium sp.]